MGQSNMVGMGDLAGGSSRLGDEISEAVVSVYEGKFNAASDYDKLTAVNDKPTCCNNTINSDSGYALIILKLKNETLCLGTGHGYVKVVDCNFTTHMTF